MCDTDLLESVKRHEGFREQSYRCTAGKWTVGYGHNLEAHGVPLEYCAYICMSEAEAERLLRSDIARSYRETEALGLLAGLNRTRRNVLVEMCFQLGSQSLSRFVNMREALVARDYARAAGEMLDSRWFIQTPGRAEELARLMAEG